MLLTISRARLDEIRAHAAAEPGREACGLLLGEKDRVERVQRCTNVAANPRHWFEIDPAALIAAYRESRAGGPQVIGHYHSHPSGQAIPSARDAAVAEPGRFWLIAAGDEITCWWSVVGGAIEGMFDPVTIR